MTLSNFLPMFDFSYTHDFGMSQNHPFNTTFYQDNDTVVLSMNWNLFNGFQDAIEYKKADADKIASHLNYLDTKNEQIYSLQTIISTIYSLLDQLVIARDAVTISEKTLAQTRLKYKSGKGLYLDLLYAQNNFRETKKSFILLENSILNSYYQLKLLIGSGDDL